MRAVFFNKCCLILLLVCSNYYLYSQNEKAAKQRSLYYPHVSLKYSIDSINDLADTLCLHKKEEGKQPALLALSLLLYIILKQG